MLKFEKQNSLLVLEYTLEHNEWIFSNMQELGEVKIKKTFIFEPNDLLTKSENSQGNKPIEFILGKRQEEYFKIEGRKLNIKHDLYISKDIELTPSFFISVRDISIFKKINELVREDIYIGGNNINTLPKEEFLRLLKEFPNSYELDKYAQARIGSILKNYLDTTIDTEKSYHQYLNKKISIKGENVYETFQNTELEKYEAILYKLRKMLEGENEYSEQQWQNEMLQIILLLYPKYISVFKKTSVKDTHNNTNRELDFLLVDADGNIDIIEVKKPFDNCIVTKSKYRDNYIPLRELSGTVMQIEKYIFYLNMWGIKGERALTKKYKDQLPKNLKVKITNPSALIIMGRDTGLNLVQIRDFEIIKRKYKNVIDILTYDDLIRRLESTIGQLKIGLNL